MKKTNRTTKVVPITEAIDTLESIVDLGEKEHREFGLTIPELKERHHIHVEDLKETLTLDRVKAIFSAVHRFIEKKAEQGETDKIKSIMLLVGEAAEKLDRYRSLFKLHTQKSITELQEYLRLKYLYAHKIERRVDENLLGKWIMGLVGTSDHEVRKERMRKQEATRHVFVDLDMVKRDKEYELLYVRKEDGARFFNPRLLRNIRIVCTFGKEAERGERFSEEIADWRDALFQTAAIDILKSASLVTKRFFAEAYRHKEIETGVAVNKSIMALMLASRAKPIDALERLEGAKGASNYFADFISFLREGLTSRLYQKLLLDPPSKDQKVLTSIFETLHQLSRALFLNMHLMKKLAPMTLTLLKEAEEAFPTTTRLKERGALLWSRLAYDYAELLKVQKQESGGTLRRLLESLEMEGYLSFDPMIQLNVPYPLFEIEVGKSEVPVLHLPSPTHQIFINRAAPLDEFKAFLLSKGRQGEEVHHLLINLQDRTSWREHARAISLEQLSKGHPFKNHLEVLTLSTDTPFYLQEENYRECDQAVTFIKTMREHLKDEASGFFLPEKLKHQLLAASPKIEKVIWEIFFDKRGYLSVKERQDFITLFYLFFTLKAIDIMRPTSISFSCKDALDIGSEYSVLLFVLFHTLSGKKIGEEEMQVIKTIAFGSPLLVRERPMLATRFNRMLSTLQLWERKGAVASESFSRELAHGLETFLSKDLLEGIAHAPHIDIFKAA